MKTLDAIKQNPAIVTFYVTFDGLTLIEGNREVMTNTNHVSDIETAMLNGEFIPPIIVDNKTGMIIDGQHRYKAACRLWKQGKEYALLAIFADFKNPLLAAISYNSGSKRWTMDNYVNAYIVDGRQSYVLLKRFCETHELLKSKGNNMYSAAIPILTGSISTSSVKLGTIKITEQQCAEGEIIYHQLQQMVEVTGNKMIIERYRSAAWIQASKIILKTMTMEKFLVLMKKYFTTPQVDTKPHWVAKYLEIADKAR